ncbi:hypothetical protein ACFLTI_05555 [Bacteroidota bacterium]
MKKLSLIVFICAIMFLFIPVKSIGQGDFSKAFGVSLKASTNGIGGDVVYNFHKRMSIRLGFEKLSYSTSYEFEEQDVSYDALIDFKTGSTSLLFDFYLVRGVFLTAGAGLNLFHVDVDGEPVAPMPFGDIEITPEMIGDFNLQVDPSNKISPYLGIGFGRTLGIKKRFSAAFEIGTYFQGPVDLTFESTGLLSPTSNPEHGQEQLLERQLDQYTMYPVIRLSFSYRIINL